MSETGIKTGKKAGCARRDVQLHQVARRNCGDDEMMMVRATHIMQREHKPVVEQSVGLVDDEMLHG
jgi:hypothetical protein